MNPTSTVTNTRPAGFLYKKQVAMAYGCTVKTLIKKTKAKGLDFGRRKYLSPAEIEIIVNVLGGEPDWQKIIFIKGKTL